MSKKYILWEIKRFLPIIGVAFVFMAIIFFPTAGNITRSIYCYPNNGMTTCYSPTTWEYNFLSISIPLIVVCLIMPFSVYDYRYSMSKADTFEQVPFRKNSIRNLRLGIGFAGIFLAMSIVYWLGVLIIFSHQSSLHASTPDSYPMFDGRGFGVIYLFLIMIAFVGYFESCFFASLGGNLLDSLLYVVCGNAILTLIAVAPALLINSFAANPHSTNLFNGSAYLMLSLLEPMIGTFSIGPASLKGVGLAQTIGSDYIGYFWSGFSLTLAIGLVALLACFFMGEPSGELATKGGKHSWWNTTVVASGIVLVALFMIGFGVNRGTTSGLGTLATILLLLWLVSYYLILALYDRSFKLTTHHWITFGVSSLAVLLFFLV